MKFLIVIDMQNDFVDMALGTKEAVAIVPNVVERILNAKDKVVITTRDTHSSDYMDTLEGKKLPVPHCILNTDGWNLNADILAALEKAKEIYRVRRDICKETFGYLNWKVLLDSFSSEIEEIEICGLCTDICVISNALILRACYPNVRIVIRSNCCAGVTPEAHEAALTVARSCQIDVI